MPARPIIPIQVCVGTYGNQAQWEPLAQRALRSVDQQTAQACAQHWCHDRELHLARNRAAELPYSPRPHLIVQPEWLCFLDADDELDPHYLEAMYDVVRHHDGPVLVQPATIGINPDGTEDPHPVLIPPKPLLSGNYLVIGTLIRADQFHRLGGFADWPLYEDWDLWIRAAIDDAEILAAPDAIYRVHVNPNGRNHPDLFAQQDTYQRIRQRHLHAAHLAGVL